MLCADWGVLDVLAGPRHGFAVRYAFQAGCARLKRSEHPEHRHEQSSLIQPYTLYARNILVGPAVEIKTVKSLSILVFPPKNGSEWLGKSA